MWFMLSNATHVTRSISKKLADTWGTDFGNIYTPQVYQSQIFLMDAISLPRGRQLCNPFGFQECHRQTQGFEARIIFIHRTLPTLLWSLCGPWFHIKSAHAVNVAILVFIWALRYKRIYQFFWNHWWRESTLFYFWFTFKILVRNECHTSTPRAWASFARHTKYRWKLKFAYDQ